MPKLDKIVCQKPIPGRAKKTVPIRYDMPCHSTPEYFETTLALLTSQIKTFNRCSSHRDRIGFCKEPQKHLKLGCNNDRRLEVNVTVELTSMENIESTKGAVKFVDMTAKGTGFEITTSQRIFSSRDVIFVLDSCRSYDFFVIPNPEKVFARWQ